MIIDTLMYQKGQNLMGKEYQNKNYFEFDPYCSLLSRHMLYILLGCKTTVATSIR